MRPVAAHLFQFMAGCSITGPISPDSIKGASLGHTLMMLNVNRPVGLGLPSKSHWGYLARFWGVLFVPAPPAGAPASGHSQSSGRFASPINRLGQRFTTINSSAFAPARAALVMSIRNGCCQRIQRLQMGSWTYVSNLLNEPPETQPQAQEVLPLCQ